MPKCIVHLCPCLQSGSRLLYATVLTNYSHSLPRQLSKLIITIFQRQNLDISFKLLTFLLDARRQKRPKLRYCLSDSDLFMTSFANSAINECTFSRSIFSQRSSMAATFSLRLSITILLPSIIASHRACSDDADAAPFIARGSASSPLMIRRRRRRLPAAPPMPLTGKHLHRSTHIPPQAGTSKKTLIAAYIPDRVRPMHGKLNSAMWSMKTLINHLLEEQKKQTQLPQ